MANTYVISYDLPAGSDYEPLYKAIKTYGTWAHITQSTWAIKTTEDPPKVRDNRLPLTVRLPKLDVGILCILL